MKEENIEAFSDQDDLALPIEGSLSKMLLEISHRGAPMAERSARAALEEKVLPRELRRVTLGHGFARCRTRTNVNGRSQDCNCDNHCEKTT
jgi:hypothetical protein